MSALADAIDALAVESAFSGVVRVDRADEVVLEQAYGFADRRWEVPNVVDTRFAIASGVKGLTALAIVSLVEDGTLELATTARSVLGDDLSLIDDRVTVEHLLAHRSGIGDYFDEDLPGEITDHVLPAPVHTLAETEDYVAVLDGFPTKFAPGERFSYCNGGYVVLALIERASGMPFRELVADRVCEPAGMVDTEFLTICRPAPRPATCVPAGCRRTCSTCRCSGRETAGSIRPWRTFGGSGRRSTRGRSSRWTGRGR